MTQGKNDQHQRKSLRLQSWDYRNAGAYFLTLVTYNRESLFGAIHNERVILTPYGEIVQEQWQASTSIRQELALDEFVVMPNHIHGIVWITEPEEREDLIRQATSPPPGAKRPKGAAPKSLGAFVAGFKSASTREINKNRNTPGAPLWQRNYHERVIRNERELAAIRGYIQANPAQWAADRENPAH